MRLAKLRTKMQEQGVESLWVTQAENRRYISGFTGSNAWLWITAQEAFIITDSRFWEQAKLEAKDFTLVKSPPRVEQAMLKAFQGLLEDYNFKGEIAFEAEHLSFAEYQRMREALSYCTFKPIDSLIEELRAIKEPEELAIIRIASRIATQALQAVLPKFKPGITEKALAREIKYIMDEMGGEKEAFDLIIGGGAHGALPHWMTADCPIKEGELVVIDIGTVVQGYHSDFTRTLWLGELPDKAKEIYAVVKEAQARALAAVKPGITCSELDAVARDYIVEKGYGNYFGHNLGHGVGLAIHEAPTLKASIHKPLQANMAVTIEPGIYLPDFGGVRIEDLVIVTSSGCEILTDFPK
jgi:Xaa-Pro aminopeptidase